ncbi:MAG: hypothetical protein ACR2HR_08900 [Euzebya sp.]
MSSPDGISDTSPEVAAMLCDAWRGMGPARKAALMVGWSAGVRRLAEVGVSQRHPDASRAELMIELGRVLYGEEVMTSEVVAAVRRRLPG